VWRRLRLRRTIKFKVVSFLSYSNISSINWYSEPGSCTVVCFEGYGEDEDGIKNGWVNNPYLIAAINN